MSLKNFLMDNIHTMQIKAETVIPTSSYVVNGGMATYGALTFNQWMMFIGAALGLATLVVNTYYQRRRDKREQELHKQKLEALKPSNKADERPRS